MSSFKNLENLENLSERLGDPIQIIKEYVKIPFGTNKESIVEPIDLSTLKRIFTHCWIPALFRYTNVTMFIIKYTQFAGENELLLGEYEVDPGYDTFYEPGYFSIIGRSNGFYGSDGSDGSDGFDEIVERTIIFKKFAYLASPELFLQQTSMIFEKMDDDNTRHFFKNIFFHCTPDGFSLCREISNQLHFNTYNRNQNKMYKFISVHESDDPKNYESVVLGMRNLQRRIVNCALSDKPLREIIQKIYDLYDEYKKTGQRYRQSMEEYEEYRENTDKI